ncbi:permease-like cell division protein FtsX [Chitinimonas koreensis]|uniref:permease-like cell division protein FtsX n=1 Tax=Chitinimonas koreensis TaxID=356302 RepID=UPI000415A0A6|nr:permease-like cell division protein FtsX [Chitinimonas koreensis]QNM97385.1 FtsX-like permease family protein [Chitinimonas koreensis]
MKHWLRLHRLALAATLRLFAASPVSSLLNLLVVGIAVALPLGLYTVVANLQQLSDKLPTDPQASVFLRPNAGAVDIARVEAAIQDAPAVKSVHRVSKDEALKSLERSSGMQDLLAGLGENPLPESFSLTLDREEPTMLDALATKLQADPAVEQVQFDSDWARRLSGIVALGREAAFTVAVLFGAGLLLVTANLIRMQILTRREEIEVSKLIGATDSFIRRPFLYFAALQGILGTAIAAGLVAFALGRIAKPVDQLAVLYGEHFTLSLAPAETLALAFLVVIALSLLGATLSVGKHLRALDR